MMENTLLEIFVEDRTHGVYGHRCFCDGKSHYTVEYCKVEQKENVQFYMESSCDGHHEEIAPVPAWEDKYWKEWPMLRHLIMRALQFIAHHDHWAEYEEMEPLVIYHLGRIPLKGESCNRFGQTANICPDGVIRYQV